VGTALTTSAKFAVIAKSPLTNRFNDAMASSTFALRGKGLGVDALIITGAVSEPAVLLVEEDTFRLVQWQHEPEVTIPTLEVQLSATFGKAWAFGVVGAAGQNGVRFASMSFGGRHAGRGGHGALLGSKNLVAIGVNGTHPTTVAHPAEVNRLAKSLAHQSQGDATAKYRELGTISNWDTFQRLNRLPTRNFQVGQFEEAEMLSHTHWAKGQGVERASCAACTIGCEHRFKTTSGGTTRLEYESLFALGSLLGISDRDAVLAAARLCDDYGLDTISTGGTIAFAMECSARGFIHDAIPFGCTDSVLSLIHQIVTRTGLGAVLAEGTRRAAEFIGGSASAFACHVKGLELPGYEPRQLPAMALGLAVGTRGADHNRSSAYEVDFSPSTRHAQSRAQAVVAAEDRATLFDSLILCKFLRGVFTEPFTETAELLRAVTGWDVEAEELRSSCRLILDAKKRYNVREGWEPSEDTLPQRFFDEALPGTGHTTGLDRTLLQSDIEAYNLARGWDHSGWPSEANADLLN
jgi:aldehyde:ferredoxin oxidoreductase